MRGEQEERMVCQTFDPRVAGRQYVCPNTVFFPTHGNLMKGLLGCKFSTKVP